VDDRNEAFVVSGVLVVEPTVFLGTLLALFLAAAPEVSEGGGRRGEERDEQVVHKLEHGGVGDRRILCVKREVEEVCLQLLGSIWISTNDMCCAGPPLQVFAFALT
jgi:hypothetical protein